MESLESKSYLTVLREVLTHFCVENLKNLIKYSKALSLIPHPSPWATGSGLFVFLDGYVLLPRSRPPARQGRGKGSVAVLLLNTTIIRHHYSCDFLWVLSAVRQARAINRTD